jgi:hypothetical protein
MSLGRAFLLMFLLHFCADSFLLAEAMREAGAVVCAPGMRGELDLESTDRVPGAHGRARLQGMHDSTAVEVELSGMKPATLFGGDYNTYILWALAGDDGIENLGEFQLDGTHSRLNAATSFATFALVVTAEPHFLVQKPSPFIALHTPQEKGRVLITYPIVEGAYNFERDTLSGVKPAAGLVHTEVKQAWTAVRLAQRMGAEEFAVSELAEVERSLDLTMALLRQGGNRKEITAQARQTVRLAVTVQNLALARASQNAQLE